MKRSPRRNILISVTAIFIAVVGTLMPVSAHAWADRPWWDKLLEKGDKLLNNDCYSCFSSGGALGVRGSEAVATSNPDGSTTWQIIDGEWTFVDRLTGANIILNSGDIHVFPSPDTILPFKYVATLAGPTSTNLAVRFESYLFDDVFNATASLRANSPGVEVIDTPIVLGTFASHASSPYYEMQINGWQPADGSDGFTWTIRYEDKFGAMHSLDSPMLYDLYASPSSAPPIPEPTTYLMIGTGLLLLSQFRGLKYGVLRNKHGSLPG